MGWECAPTDEYECARCAPINGCVRRKLPFADAADLTCSIGFAIGYSCTSSARRGSASAVAAECILCAWADPHLSQCLKQRGSGRQEGQLRQDRARYSRSVPLSPLMDVYFCTADESPPVCVSAESRGGEAFEVLVKSMGLEVGAGGALSDEASPPYGGSPTGGASPPGTPTITQMVKNTHMAEEVKRGAFTTPFRLPFGKLKADGSSKDDSFKSVDNPASRDEGDEEGEGGDERVRGDGKREKKHKRDKSGGGHALSKLMQVCVCVCVFVSPLLNPFLSFSFLISRFPALFSSLPLPPTPSPPALTQCAYCLVIDGSYPPPSPGSAPPQADRR